MRRSGIGGKGAEVHERLLGAACLAVLVVIFSLGWWPFHVPRNDVSWLGTRNGLRLGHYSTIIGTAPLEGDGTGSVEIWLQPARIWTGGTFLSFSQPEHETGLRIQQSQTDLTLDVSSRQQRRKLSVKEIFHRNGPLFLTVTSGADGTAVYVDGVRVKADPQFRFSPAALAGVPILGDEPGQSDSWAGWLFGAAIYREALPPDRVVSHYRSWTAGGQPDLAAKDGCAALYLFKERSGNSIHSQAGHGAGLQIPARYSVVDQRFLEPFWEEFSLSMDYAKAVLKNIVGFVPFGFLFYAYLAGVHGFRRALLWTVLLGTLTSFTIEILQRFLPTRDSGTSDLFTNTFGTWLGALLYLRLHRIAAALFPWLPIFPEPRR